MPMPVYTQVAVINQSTVVTDVEGSAIVAALNSLLPTFCSDWSISRVTASYVPLKSKSIPSNAYKVFILDTTDIQGTLGYHDIVSDLPYAKVFAKTNVAYGGVTLYEPTRTKPTLAQAVSHEVFEMLVDPKCVNWWMNPNNGYLFAGEVGDPVESNVVVVRLPNGTNVGMSDWILPAWSDVQNTRGPFNHMDTLLNPFTMAPGGYLIYIKAGVIHNVYGDAVLPSSKLVFASRIRSLARNTSIGVNTIPLNNTRPFGPASMGLSSHLTGATGTTGATGATGQKS
jgi:hypothetical protein